jgi:hypothetical protein
MKEDMKKSEDFFFLPFFTCFLFVTYSPPTPFSFSKELIRKVLAMSEGAEELKVGP